MSAQLQKPKPGLATVIIVPLAVWFVASIVAVVLVVMGAMAAQDTYDDLARFDTDVATEVELSDTGGYRVWILSELYEYEQDVIAPTVTITGPDGGDVVVRDYVGSLTYTDASAVATFDADVEGVYTIEVSSVDGRVPQAAVGKGNPFAEAGKGVLWMILVGTLGFVVALILFIVLMVRRSRSRRRINDAYRASGGFGGPGGYGHPGGYAQPGGYSQPGGYAQPGGYPQPGAFGSPGGFPPPGGSAGTPPPPGTPWS